MDDVDSLDIRMFNGVDSGESYDLVLVEACLSFGKDK